MTPQAVLTGEARWCVVEGDCLEVLPTIGRVDHVICDPPYDQHTSESARTIRGAIRNDRAVAEEGMGRERYIPFNGIDPAVVGPALVGVASRWAIAFCALEQLGAYKAAVGAAWVRAGFWHRLGGAPQFSGDRPAQSGEGVAIMRRPGKKRWHGGGHAAFWECPRMATGVQPMAAERVHPTQKPIEILLEMLGQFTDPDDIILDPFAGSGTTGVAALRLGRRAILIEKDPTYAALVRERMEAEAAGTTLRAARAGQTTLFGGAPR